MSSPKLIFSFATGVEFVINRDELPDLAVIKFGQGFDDTEVKFGDVVVAMMKPEMNKPVEPIVKFNLKSVEELPMPKKEWIEKNSNIAVKSAARSVGIAPKMVSALTVGFTTTVPVAPPMKGKEVLHEEESVDAHTLPFSRLEVGSNSKTVQLMKAQERRRSQEILKVKQPRTTMTQKLNMVYPFKDEAVAKIFRDLLKMPEFRLPEPKRPEEMNKKDHPNFCPYHRLLGHKIEGCFSFKDWLEKNVKSGNVMIPKEYLKELEKGSVNMISDDSIDFYTTPVLEEISDVSRKSSADLKVLKGKSIESALEKLRADIVQLSKDRKEDIEDENYDLADFAEVNVVETRVTPSSCDASLPTEENTVDEFQKVIQQRDEQISQMKKQLEEIMTAMVTMQRQSQPPQMTPPETSQPEAIYVTDKRKEFTSDEQPKKDSVQGLILENDIKQMVEQQVREALVQSKTGESVSKGRPYPEEFDTVQYPRGFISPLFRTFEGTGNPRQHVAHFRASCCNAGGSDALLFRQFVSSLSGIAFDWYAELPNGSVKTFAEMENIFVKRFAGAQHHITVGDLVVEKQKPDETLVEYILRWRNLCMRCEPKLHEQHAIDILLKSIHGPVGFLLKGLTIKTFEKLLSKAGSLQEEAKQLDFLGKANELEPTKIFEKKSGTVVVVGGGKRQLQVQAEQHQRTFQRPRQNAQQYFQQRPYRTNERQVPTMVDRANKVYSFKDEAARKMFRSLIKNPEFRLPEPKKPDEVNKKGHLRYCPYHRFIGHTIEECCSFKDWLEENFKDGNITIPEEYLKRT